MVIAAVLMTAALTGIFSTSTMAAYAQFSEIEEILTGFDWGEFGGEAIGGGFRGIDENLLESEIERVQNRNEQARDDCLKILKNTDPIIVYRQCIASADEAFASAMESIVTIVEGHTPHDVPW